MLSHKWIFCKLCNKKSYHPDDIKNKYCPVHKYLKEGQFLIGKEFRLTLEERNAIVEKGCCPNCNGNTFLMKKLDLTKAPPDSPIQHTVIYMCEKCGCWTNYFDGWKWYSKEELEIIGWN
jgi:uncharacterized protein with PIN domain